MNDPIELLKKALEVMKLINGDDNKCVHGDVSKCRNHRLIHQIENFLGEKSEGK